MNMNGDALERVLNNPENPENISAVLLSYASEALNKLGKSDLYEAGVTVQKAGGTDPSIREDFGYGRDNTDPALYGDYAYLLSLRSKNKTIQTEVSIRNFDRLKNVEDVNRQQDRLDGSISMHVEEMVKELDKRIGQSQ